MYMHMFISLNDHVHVRFKDECMKMQYTYTRKFAYSVHITKIASPGSVAFLETYLVISKLLKVVIWK